MSTSSIQLEVQSEHRSPQKWKVPLTEEVFRTFMSKEDPTVRIVFGDGSLFSPLLFGKFFDPSDNFPLWDFESKVLLSKVRSYCETSVDWFQNDTEFVLKTEPSGFCNNSVKVLVEQEKVLEISGQWKALSPTESKDWKSGPWWEYGFVRRIELPENGNWSKIEAYLKNDTILEIKVPKILSNSA